MNADLLKSKGESYLQPNSYIAVINDSLFVEEGLSDYKSKNSLEIIFGICKDTPNGN
jgi:hypothetical protein